MAIERLTDPANQDVFLTADEQPVRVMDRGRNEGVAHLPFRNRLAYPDSQQVDSAGGQASLPNGWRELSLPQKIGAVGGVIAIAGGLITVLAFFGIRGLGDDQKSGDQKPKRSNLQAVDVVVTNPTEQRSVPGSREDIDPNSYAKASITLLNTGDQTSVLKRAYFTVRAVGVAKVCTGRGGALAEEKYGVRIPHTASRGDKVVVEGQALRSQLAPGETSEYTFSFTTDLGPNDDPASYLFQLDVGITHDFSNKPLSVGKIILALNTAPTEDDLWTAKTASLRFSDPDEAKDAKECFQRNNEQLRRFLRLGGTVDPQLKSLRDKV